MICDAKLSQSGQYLCSFRVLRFFRHTERKEIKVQKEVDWPDKITDATVLMLLQSVSSLAIKKAVLHKGN